MSSDDDNEQLGDDIRLQLRDFAAVRTRSGQLFDAQLPVPKDNDDDTSLFESGVQYPTQFCPLLTYLKAWRFTAFGRCGQTRVWQRQRSRCS